MLPAAQRTASCLKSSTSTHFQFARRYIPSSSVPKQFVQSDGKPTGPVETSKQGATAKLATQFSQGAAEGSRAPRQLMTPPTCRLSQIRVYAELGASARVCVCVFCWDDSWFSLVFRYQPVDIIQPTNHVLPASFGDSDWHIVTGNSVTATNESPRRKPSQHELEKQRMPGDYFFLLFYPCCED